MAPIRIEVPRDRDGSFEPLLIPKHERRFTGFDEKIVAMYARRMTGETRQPRISRPAPIDCYARFPDFTSVAPDSVAFMAIL